MVIRNICEFTIRKNELYGSGSLTFIAGRVEVKELVSFLYVAIWIAKEKKNKWTS